MKPSPATDAETPVHRLIHRAGIVVLVVGIVSSIVIYVWAASHGSGSSTPDFSADRRFNYEIERVGGKFTVYAAAFNRWLGTLWAGTTLAYTVAALSVVTALLCFWLADFMSYPALDDSPHPPKTSGD